MVTISFVLSRLSHADVNFCLSYAMGQILGLQTDFKLESHHTGLWVLACHL